MAKRKRPKRPNAKIKLEKEVNEIMTENNLQEQMESEDAVKEEPVAPAEETAQEEPVAPAEETQEELEAPAEETAQEEPVAPAEETAQEEPAAPAEETAQEETEAESEEVEEITQEEIEQVEEAKKTEPISLEGKKAYIEILPSDKVEAREVPLFEKTEMMIGRSHKKSDFVICKDSVISRAHMTIAFDRESKKFIVRDMSRNGVFHETGKRFPKKEKIKVSIDTKIYLANTDYTLKLIVK